MFSSTRKTIAGLATALSVLPFIHSSSALSIPSRLQERAVRGCGNYTAHITFQDLELETYYFSNGFYDNATDRTYVIETSSLYTARNGVPALFEFYRCTDRDVFDMHCTVCRHPNTIRNPRIFTRPTTSELPRSNQAKLSGCSQQQRHFAMA